MSRQSDICITVFILGEERSVLTYKNEYRNLMMLLYDKFYLENFGECKGMGRCGTCHIEVSGNFEACLVRVETKIQRYKMAGVTDNSRLACQLNVDEKLDGLVIKIISDM